MKITLITACFNSEATIRTAMESVLAQKGVDIEYIVVDGGSKDGTVDIVKEYSTRSTRSTRLTFKWISEPDKGMYDAINKGIKMATGDIVGILNADDVLASDDTLAHIAGRFSRVERVETCRVGEDRSNRVERVDRVEEVGELSRVERVDRVEEAGELSRVERVETCRGEEEKSNHVDGERVDAVYADIRFVKEGETVEALREARTVRYCSAKRWRPWMFRFAAMVPHPSFYVRRECFERLGGYSLDYRICADFELELRYLYLAKLKAAYLPECVVVMRMGGMSTAGWRSNVVINCEDLRALRSHGVWSCLPLIYLKYLFKIWGFVFRGRKR